MFSFSSLCRLLAASLVAISPTSCRSMGEARPSPSTKEGAAADRLQPLLDELVGGSFGTGASLSVSERGILSTVTAGVLNGGGAAVQGETAFNVASVSKLLTASAVHVLAHEGRLDLDASVRMYLPGVLLLDGAGRDRTEEVTLRKLLSHRGGVPHQPGSLEPASFGSSWSDPRLLGRLVADWSITLENEPGTYRYSNIGYALLGAILEDMGEATFAEAMQPTLRDFGMEGSTFWPSDLRSEGAWGRVEVGGAVRFNEPAWYGTRYAAPFTGLWATSADLARFGERLIEHSSDPGSALFEMARLDGDLGHGLGPVRRERAGLISIEHDGGGPGFLAALLAFPERQLVLTVVCNADGETRGNALHFVALLDKMIQTLLLPDQTTQAR